MIHNETRSYTSSTLNTIPVFTWWQNKPEHQQTLYWLGVAGIFWDYRDKGQPLYKWAFFVENVILLSYVISHKCNICASNWTHTLNNQHCRYWWPGALSTRSSVATMLSTHPCISSCFWVKFWVKFYPRNWSHYRELRRRNSTKHCNLIDWSLPLGKLLIAQVFKRLHIRQVQFRSLANIMTRDS